MQTVWLFDLDNTLHDASWRIFPHINRSMTEYVMVELGLDEAKASDLREYYWHRYGATLQGLVRHHGTHPAHFLRQTHAFADLGAMLLYERALSSALRRLPGKKIIFSNGPHHYAEAVLAHMGIRRYFDAVFAIEHARFSPKPGLTAFHRLLHRHQLVPEQCILVEDTAENLRPARRLGMGTVLVSPKVTLPAWVDVRIRSVADLPRLLGKLKRGKSLAS